MQGIVRGRMPRRSRRGVRLGTGLSGAARRARWSRDLASLTVPPSGIPGSRPATGRCSGASTSRRIAPGSSSRRTSGRTWRSATASRCNRRPGPSRWSARTSDQWKLDISTRGAADSSRRSCGGWSSATSRSRWTSTGAPGTGSSSRALRSTTRSATRTAWRASKSTPSVGPRLRSATTRSRRGDSPIEVDAEPEEGPLEVEITNNRITTSDQPAGVDTNRSGSGMRRLRSAAPPAPR